MPNEAEFLPTHFLCNTIEAALRGLRARGSDPGDAARSNDRKKRERLEKKKKNIMQIIRGGKSPHVQYLSRSTDTCVKKLLQLLYSSKSKKVIALKCFITHTNNTSFDNSGKVDYNYFTFIFLYFYDMSKGVITKVHLQRAAHWPIQYLIVCII